MTTLHSFTGKGTDGVGPQAELIQGSDGNFYGTTASGGSSGYGTVFRLTPAGALTTLYSFTNIGTDGADPEASLIQGSDGSFYGTTRSGGSSFYFGTVFRITPNGVLTTLHSFTETGTDGADPVAGLVQGRDGNFYGTTKISGSGFGTVFRITPAGEYITLHNFTGIGTDGTRPQAGLIQGSDGKFYGTTANGGGRGYGVVFRITPTGEYSTLHTFTGIGLDGQAPYAGLTQGRDASFYGTTASGGSNESYGTVFRITPAGSYHTLYSFTGSGGAAVYAGLIQGRDGNFYGTTEYGGSDSGGVGTIYELTPAGTHTVLHRFTNTGADGGYPKAGLIQGRDGSFYGTTPDEGGSLGTIFRLSFVTDPVAAPTVDLAISGTGVAMEGGTAGVLIVTRTGSTDAALTVNYKVKGTAKAGVDYKPLPGIVTIPAGSTKAKIAVKPINGSPNEGILTIKVALIASGDGSYAVGRGVAKLKLIGR